MIIGLPRALQRLLVGGQAPMRRPQRPLPQFVYPRELLATAKADPQQRRDYTAGAFVVEDEEPTRAPAIQVQAVDAAAAAALAEDLKQFTVDAHAPTATAVDGDPDPRGARARPDVPRGGARA